MKNKKSAKKKAVPRSKNPSYLPGSRVKMSVVKHLLPPVLGLTIMLAVLGLFNSQWLAAQIFKRTYKPPAEVAVQDTTLANTPVADPNAPAKIIINGINVEAPVIYDQDSVNEAAFQLALRNGVVHYPGTAEPGKVGNVVIFGHSSGQVWAPGNYKFVFMHLDRLNAGDKIFLEYQGTRYEYEVTGKSVVAPTQLSVLDQPDSDRVLTLITCTPVGSNKNRLIISAKQVAPQPPAVPMPTETQPTINTEVHALPSQSSAGFIDSVKTFFRNTF